MAVDAVEVVIFPPVVNFHQAKASVTLYPQSKVYLLSGASVAITDCVRVEPLCMYLYSDVPSRQNPCPIVVSVVGSALGDETKKPIHNLMSEIVVGVNKR